MKTSTKKQRRKQRAEERQLIKMRRTHRKIIQELLKGYHLDWNGDGSALLHNQLIKAPVVEKLLDTKAVVSKYIMEGELLQRKEGRETRFYKVDTPRFVIVINEDILKK